MLLPVICDCVIYDDSDYVFVFDHQLTACLVLCNPSESS